jgi:hypothetical protein
VDAVTLSIEFVRTELPVAQRRDSRVDVLSAENPGRGYAPRMRAATREPARADRYALTALGVLRGLDRVESAPCEW